MYFDALRAVVRRVVTAADETGLSADEKNTLLQRLLEHVSSLEAVNIIFSDPTGQAARMLIETTDGTPLLKVLS